MTYYPLIHDEQCMSCGGLPAGNELIGKRMVMFPGTRWHECRCPKR